MPIDMSLVKVYKHVSLINVHWQKMAKYQL